LEANVLLIAFALVALVLFFEFSNGFNDCANMVATPVITGALAPHKVLIIIAFFEFIGALFLGTAVAQTLGKGIVSPANVNLTEIFAALLGAIFWNIGGWYFGMPSSSSHALIGGLLGAVAMGSGLEWIHWGKVWEVLAILIFTPILGLIAGSFLTKKMLLLFETSKPSRANHLLKKWQILTSITLALSHGSNDAQKGMGLITLSLIILHGISPAGIEKIYQPLSPDLFFVPKWVILACSLALALGVSFGGWRIMKTLGAKLYKIRPVHGFSAQACSSLIIYFSSLFGFPVSTTQIVSSSILGAGSTPRLGSVRWGIGKQIFLTWLITIPGSAILSGLFFLLINSWI